MAQMMVGGDISHAREMAPRLREADRLEIFRGSGMSPLEGLEFSLKGSRNTFWLEHEGRVEAMGGCSPVPWDERVGQPWLLGTDFIAGEGRRWFIQNTPAIWATQSHKYEWLWNLVDAQNAVHIRWLERSGCRFIGRRLLNGNPFIEFTKQCVSP